MASTVRITDLPELLTLSAFLAVRFMTIRLTKICSNIVNTFAGHERSPIFWNLSTVNGELAQGLKESVPVGIPEQGGESWRLGLQ